MMSESDQQAIVPDVDGIVQESDIVNKPIHGKSYISKAVKTDDWKSKHQRVLGRVRSRLEAELPRPNPLLPRPLTQKLDTPNGKRTFCCWKSEEQGIDCKIHPRKRRKCNSIEFSRPRTVMEEQFESFANSSLFDVTTAGLQEESGPALPSSNQARSLFQSPYWKIPSEDSLKGYRIPKKGRPKENNANKTIGISPCMEQGNPQPKENNDRNDKRNHLLQARAKKTTNTSALNDKKVSRLPKQITSKNAAQFLAKAKKTLSEIQRKKKAALPKRKKLLKEMDEVNGKCFDVGLKRVKAINYLSSTWIRDLHPRNPKSLMDAGCEFKRLGNHIIEIAKIRGKLEQGLEKLQDGYETRDTDKDSLYRLYGDTYNEVSVLEENNVPTSSELQPFLDWAEDD